MNLHHLMIFNAIAATGSITSASQQLHISQPALSRELRVFEARLGITLFERHARGMHLTQPGLLLRGYAERLFALEAEASSAMRAVAQARSGRLAIGASNTVGTYVLPALLAEFRRDYTDAELALFVENTQHVAEGVADMRFMLGFIEGPLHTPGLTAEVFQADEILPVVARDHPLTRRASLDVPDLVGETLLLREVGSGTRELIDRLRKTHNLLQAPVMECSTTEALKQAAIHGGGVAWLPRIAIADELKRGVLAPLPLGQLNVQRVLSVIRREGAYLPPLAQALLDRLLRAA